MVGPAIDLSFLKLLLVVGTLTIARTTGLFLITPFLGRGIITGLARNAVILALTLPVIPHALASRPPGFDPSDLVLVMGLTLKELLIGLLLGLPLTAVAWGVEAAGFMIDNQRGASMASMLNPASGNQTSPLGILLGQLYTVWLVVSGGFTSMLDLLYRSESVWPTWGFLPNFSTALPGETLSLLDTVMKLTLLMAGPAMIAMFLSEFGLALVSRFAPQLQVFFLAMPVKSGVGLLLLVLSLGVILETASRYQLSAPATLSLISGWFH
jgi:type III secretion protein T